MREGDGRTVEQGLRTARDGEAARRQETHRDGLQLLLLAVRPWQGHTSPTRLQLAEEAGGGSSETAAGADVCMMQLAEEAREPVAQPRRVASREIQRGGTETGGAGL
nr:unnamed protein product [Digitaria exilis]